MSVIRDEIARMKQNASLEQDSLMNENDALKTKVLELEQQLSSMLNSEAEVQIRERLNYEKRFNRLSEEN